MHGCRLGAQMFPAEPGGSAAAPGICCEEMLAWSWSKGAHRTSRVICRGSMDHQVQAGCSHPKHCSEAALALS
jgi:hypothetical protein